MQDKRLDSSATLPASIEAGIPERSCIGEAEAKVVVTLFEPAAVHDTGFVDLPADIGRTRCEPRASGLSSLRIGQRHL